MYVCMYVYIYTYACMDVQKYACMYVRMSLHMYVCLSVSLYVCIYVHMYVSMSVYLYVCMSASLCMPKYSYHEPPSTCVNSLCMLRPLANSPLAAQAVTCAGNCSRALRRLGSSPVDPVVLCCMLGAILQDISGGLFNFEPSFPNYFHSICSEWPLDVETSHVHPTLIMAPS